METLKVEQCDRDAAAEYASEGGWGDGRAYWLANALDSHPLIQAFARHRIAERERNAGIAEQATTEAQAVITSKSTDQGAILSARATYAAATHIAQAIRAASDD